MTLASVLNTTAPTGAVTFYDNGTVLGIVPVSSATVTLAVGSLPRGTDVLYASYSGDANFNIVAATNTVSVTVTPLVADFTLSAATPASLSLVQGQTGTFAVGITSNATFNGVVTFTCTGAPAEASCTVLPGTMTVGGSQTASATVVVSTTAPNNHSEARTRKPTWMQTSGGITFAVCFVLLPALRRKRLPRWLGVLILMVFLGASSAILGCGGSSKYPGTPAGNFVLTVTATSGSITQSTTVALKISK